MIPGSANPLLLAPAAGGYQVSRSLRFNSSDSGFCSRTFGTATSRKTWTWAGWVKRSYVGATYKMLFSADNGAHSCGFRFTNSPSDTIEFFEYNGGFTWQLVTTQVFRDPSAWYHIVVVFDSTQGTSTNRLKLYVNGTQVTAFGTASYPSLNYDSLINAAVAHNIGAYAGIQNFDGYLADIHFIDGQALTPSSFTEVSATTGQLLPKAYSGSYGTNGFYLQFADNSSNTAATLGKDTSGNGNNWTPNNFSVTAGAGNDSLVDTPTSNGTDTGVGGEVRGNYCTLNPLTAGFGGTLSNGNLDYNLGSGTRRAEGTIAVTSGKWYWEGYAVSGTRNGSVGGRFGFTVTSSLNDPEKTPFQLTFHASIGLYRADSSGSFTLISSGSYTDGDLLGCGLDADSNIGYFYKNGSLLFTFNFSSYVAAGSAFLTPHSWNASSGTPVWEYNFGQRAFAYTAPSGFKALCDTNLGAPLVAKPNTVMDVKLYTATDGVSGSVSGVNFSPDFVWIKSRAVARSNVLMDTVRGTSSVLWSNLTDAQLSSSQYVSQFNSDGFNYGVAGDVSNGSTVAWLWDAGSTTVTNTQGSITSQVRANASAGFSVVTYTANGSNAATIGHGLGVKPSLIIHKQRTKVESWRVYHISRTSTGQFLSLNGTGALGSSSDIYPAEPTSTVFTPGNEVSMNSGTENCVAYCFAPVVGYSSFGSYVGNGSSDGVFVYTGFRPRWIMFKRTQNADGWLILDAARNAYNVADLRLEANSSGAETDSSTINVRTDFLSNGFRLRGNWGGYNQNAETFIYAAFAENPFQYARAR